MELNDVPDNGRNYLSSLSAQNRIKNEIPFLLISFRKQENRDKKYSSDVVIRPAALLHSVQYTDHLDHHTYQLDNNHHISSSLSSNFELPNSISIIQTWPGDIFFTFLTAISIGVLVLVVWIVFWFRNHIWRTRQIFKKKTKFMFLGKGYFNKMEENRIKLWNSTNAETCFKITITEAESRPAENQNKCCTEHNKIVNKNKEMSSHMNMSQLETGLKANKNSQQQIDSNCIQNTNCIYVHKQRPNTKDKSVINDTKKKADEEEYSFSYLQSQINTYKCKKLVETSSFNDPDLSSTSNSTQIKSDLYSNDENKFLKRDVNYAKLSILNFESEKDSMKCSNTSTCHALIPPETPPSLSSSAISSAVDITPNAIVGDLNSSGKGNNLFTFSPKMLNERKIDASYHTSDINSRSENSYYRFPDVDSFTPTTIQSDDKALRRNSLIYPSISPKQYKQKPVSKLTVQVADTDSNANSSADQCILHAQNNTSLSIQATRRARLTSISLDSEGARLIEENLSSGIPVEELVERTVRQMNFDSVQCHPLEKTTKKMFASGKKHRNILNLKLILNDQDKSLTHDKDSLLNDFCFEYYDYDDQEETDCSNKLNHCTGYSENKFDIYSQKLQPKTPTLNLTREKAKSLDSDQYLNYVPPSTNPTYYGAAKQPNTNKTLLSSIPVSSLSVPTTPKRQLYHLPHQQQQSHMKPKQYGSINDNCCVFFNSSSSDRSVLSNFKHKLCCFDEKSYVCHNQKVVEDDKLPLIMKAASNNQSYTNLKTLPEITPCKQQKPSADNHALQNSHKSRPSILHRRGSNHSLTLNLDAPKTLNKGLSVSNFSLGNHKGSFLNLVTFSSNGYHHSDQQPTQNQRSNIQTKKNLLQRRGSNTSLVLNLQGSTASLNRYNSHNSLNIHNQIINRPLKKGLIERRNSNTSLTLLNIQNQALSVSNCNLPGSNCSLNSMVTYQTQNEGLMFEEDEQVNTNNNQSRYCSIVDFIAENSTHFSSRCAQHASRRKFLSSDSIHNIARSRVLCSCQQEQKSVENFRISQNRDSTIVYCESLKKSDQSIQTFKNLRACSTKTNTRVTSSSMFKLRSATASTNNLTQYNNCEWYHCSCEHALNGGLNFMNVSNDNIRKITTKPLSPQTTSEDFKIYLANIQFLQNASNNLSFNYMKNLHLIFNGTYGNYDKTHDSNVLNGENNDVKLTNLSNVTISPNTYRMTNMDTEKQKQMILKIHQEFWDLPTNYQEKPLVFGSQSKNRYKTILPNEHSRVILGAESDNLTEPYINANFIKVRLLKYLSVQRVSLLHLPSQIRMTDE